MFLYGAPGNGKTTLAERITLCFGQEIWIPRVIIVDDQIIKLFDPAYHKEVAVSQNKIYRQHSHDQRWTKIRRPTVIVGGELTLDCLEIRHDARSNVSEAPLQMKSNNGSLLIDDFGRQRLDPMELLNRWIVPLEKRYDFLTLASGKKIQVPFDQLILFSTNLEPTDLAEFELIVPCGISDKAVTSIERELDTTIRRMPAFEDVANMVSANFGRVFSRQVLWCETLDVLLKSAPSLINVES